jgi:cytochrome c oxidase subunit 5b
MLQSALRTARPFVARSSRVNAARAFSITPRVASDGPPPPQLIGPGGKPGEVPSDYEQLTGLARLQLLGEMQGIKIFDDSPLDSSRLGTKADPILVQSYVGVLDLRLIYVVG